MLVVMLAIPSWSAWVPPHVAARSLARSAASSRTPLPLLQVLDPDDDDDDDDAPQEKSSEEMDAFRASLMRQMGGGQFGGGSADVGADVGADVDEDEDEDEEADAPVELAEGTGVNVEDDRARLASLFSGGGAAEPEATSDVGKARESGVPAKGSVLVANPQRFCSRNPFARAVKDLNRFGLQGPVQGGDLSADTKAQMLPVLLLIEHGDKGSSGVLLERRTGALMGDISMDEYGCVAISPLWLGGTEQQNSLFCVHNCPEVEGATELNPDGLMLGGWEAARPKVADSSLAEGRFKFFLGATEWKAGQLQEEIEAGAWLVLDCDAELVMKDRVSGWQPGQPKPLWTELVKALGDDFKPIMQLVYADE
jgi:putative AlgH/UPF0301 family transcriptional regulator